MAEKLNLDSALSTKLRGYDKNEVNAYVSKLMSVNATEKESLQKTIDDLRAALTQARNDSAAVVKKYNELYQAGDARAKAVAASCQSKMDEAAQELVKLRNQVSELSAENARLKQGSEEDIANATRTLQAALDEKNQAIASLHAQMETLNEQISNLNEAQGQMKASHDAELAKCKAVVDKAQADMTEAQKTAESYKKQLSDGELSGLRKSVQSLQSQLAEQKAGGERLQAENQSLKKHTEQLASANKQAADQIVGLQQDLKDAEAKYAKQAGYIEGLIHELETAYSAKLKFGAPKAEN